MAPGTGSRYLTVLPKQSTKVCSRSHYWIYKFCKETTAVIYSGVSSQYVAIETEIFKR